MTTENNKTIVIPEDLTELELVARMMNLRTQLKQWQRNHKDSLLGKNLLYGIKAAVNMAASGELLACDKINEVILEKCADG